MTADLTEQRVRELIREELAARSFFSVEPPSVGVEGAASGDTGAAHPEGGAR